MWGNPESLEAELLQFSDFGARTIRAETRVRPSETGPVLTIPTYINEFWTSKQRAASSLHEVSYRACFKPQLPRFFIQRLTTPGDIVYDSFMGRGTTAVEAALLGRIPYGCDVNPLSEMLTRPRLAPPSSPEVACRLGEIDFCRSVTIPDELLVFYHPRTLRQIVSLRTYLLEREVTGKMDDIDRWIRLVALNRLTGHSTGFFSVYTLPPNQAVSVESQRRINQKRNQAPGPKDVSKLILSKTLSLVRDCDDATRDRLRELATGRITRPLLLTGPSDCTPGIASRSVALVVTSPPFLDVVNYADDNWLRCWFAGIDPREVRITRLRKLEDWQEAMTGVFRELARVLKPGGHVAFEVGEVRGGEIRLEEAVIPCGVRAGLDPRLVVINAQEFTKTANCWGVENGRKGTNTNRIVLFRKSA